MNEQQASELWAQYLDGELTARQRAALRQLLSADAARRDRFVDDLQLDGMLRTLDHIDATGDDFVARVAGKLEDVDREVDQFPLASEPVECSSALQSSRLSAPPPVPPPVESAAADIRSRADAFGSDAFASDASETRSVSEALDTTVAFQKFPARLRKHAIGLAIGTAALILIALAAAIVFVATQDADRMAKDNDQQQLPAGDEAWPDGQQDELVIEQPDVQPNEHPLPRPGDIAPSERDERETQIVDQPRRMPDQRDVVERDGNESLDKPTFNDSPRPISGAIPDAPQDDSEVVGRLTKSIRAVWQSQPQTDLTKKKPLSLTSGIVEVTMNDGVALTVLGPAEFRLDATGRVLLTRGRLNALVPGQATGFRIDTPSSQVIDLGTEFDVSVDEHGETAVRVHQGEVEMASLPSTDAEPMKWNLRQGQFKTLRRDGASHDFYLATDLDRSGRGSVEVNGIEFVVLDRQDFDAARAKVREELANFRRDVVSQRGTAFSGVIKLDGETTHFATSSQFLAAWRQANDHFDRVEELLDRVSSLSGSININGTEIKFNNFQNLMEQSDVLKRMGVGGWASGVGNLRELMKVQEELMRLGEDGANPDAERKTDVRGSINFDGKAIDFGNLEELIRLRDSLRGTRRGDRRERPE